MIRHTRALLPLLSILAALASAPVRAEDTLRTIDKGRVELSTAASFNVFTSNDANDSVTVVELPLRIGYFVTRRAELEGELLYSHFGSDNDDDANDGFQGSARLLWHFGSQRTLPFVFAGGGIGNAMPLGNLLIEVEDTTLKHAEVGAGIKAFVGERAALRAEYRFRHYFGDGRRDFFGLEDGPGGNEHRLFVGLAVFLR
jgi:hypothetical protein